MKASLDDRIHRAARLAQVHPGAALLLNFYRELAQLQKQVSEDLQSNGEIDVRALARHFPALIALVRHRGTELLVNFAAQHLGNTPVQEKLLTDCWVQLPAAGVQADAAGRFYARVLLQPYAEYLASRGDIRVDGAGPICPFCNARPLAGVLRGEGDGAKRWLLCSLCSTEWPFRRVVCPACGEENKDKLPIYTSDQFESVRVEACDSCWTYLKSVDLTKDGHAVPLVDELATVALSIWAEEHGYSKLETNLLAM